FTVDMSLKRIAPGLGVTGKALARELGLPLHAPKRRRLEDQGVSQERLDDAGEHLLSHRGATLKYYIFAALALFGLVFMLRLGRPDLAVRSERKLWYPRAPHVAVLLISIIACGFALGKSPNPMEGTVKLFKAMVGLYPSVAGKAVAFGFFMSLAVIGNKLVCGWACPFGALQELIYSLPMLRSAKRMRPPFWLSNTVRSGLFCVMLLLLFGIVGDRRGFVLYHSLNPFNLFDLHLEDRLIIATVVAALAGSFVMYRPFCQWICPFGLASWLGERLSLARVTIDRASCTECGSCVQACPSGAAKGILDGSRFAADCFSCGRCLSRCPGDAIRYGWVFGKRGPAPARAEDRLTKGGILAMANNGNQLQ
ncbi:4Fe-4S binding protein, partial [Elusimicrobiota bacterium]